jgi:hypothetical protein
MYLGGIAGTIQDQITITNSYNTGDVTIGSAATLATSVIGAGGISARAVITNPNVSAITNSYNAGSVETITGSLYWPFLSGILGTTDNNAAITLKNNVSAGAYVKGTNRTTSTQGKYFSRIIYVYTMSQLVNMENNFILDTLELTNCYGTSALTCATPPASTSYYNANVADEGTEKTITELQTQTTYTDAIADGGTGGLGWLFGSDDDNPWKMPGVAGLPILYWQP